MAASTRSPNSGVGSFRAVTICCCRGRPEGGGVRVEVADGSPRPSVLAGEVPDDDAEGGRELVLLDAVVGKWGVGPGDGKTVWFECEDAAERPGGASPAPEAGDAR